MKQVTIEAHTSAIQLSGNNVLYLHILIFPWEVLHPVPRIFLDVFCQYHRFAWTLFVLVLGNVLFNDALNTFYLRLYGVRHMVKDHSDTREETHICYSFRLAARVLLYASSQRQDNTYHGLCYTSRGALAGTRNSSMGPPHEGSIRRPIAP